MFNADTIAAVATPPGEGGIAIIRVSGRAAFAVAAGVFVAARGGNPLDFAGYSVHYGAFTDRRTGEISDDGLLTCFRAPHSYTGEDTVEFSCHGGRAAPARVLQLALEAGARLAEPGEFTQRAFLNGRLDLAQAEAVADVIRATTDAARRQARRQLDGALSMAIVRLKEVLIGILAAIEVTIDFSDEVGELEYPPLRARITEARTQIESLLATADRGRIAREGLRIAIVGRPNVGKSSLLNALLRADRAIVTPIAGTTRDVVEESANLRGIPLVLLDTAGLRESEDVVEKIGVERAETASATSDLLLFVLDATTGVTAEDRAIVARLNSVRTGTILTVINKIDAAPLELTWETARIAKEAIDLAGPVVLLSARTSEGLDRLEAAIYHIAQGEAFDAQTAANLSWESVVVSNARHLQALTQARDSLLEAEKTTGQLLPGDFIAIDVRGALTSLGLITGETVTEEIIHRIFHDFCVGK